MSANTTTTQQSALNVVMGAMTFGAPGQDGARVTDINDVVRILDIFRSHGHTEIDTARVYCRGTSEEYLGKIDLASKGLKVETKLYPWPGVIKHNEEDIRKHVAASLKALNAKSVDIWYLHGPDRSVPYEETLRVVNDLYKEGFFKRFGISNYMSWEVAELVGICKAKGYIMPTVYQGLYNVIHRAVEPELFPCLRKFGISFYEFNPLMGGFITGRYTSLDDSSEPGSRFDPGKLQGRLYRERYWREPYFKALSEIKEAADKHNFTLAEVALRWMSHHSLLKREHGDAIIIGASSIKHIEENLNNLEKGPLPEDVLKALDKAWFDVKAYCSPYYHDFKQSSSFDGKDFQSLNL